MINRIAVASSDGKVVNQHFGHARQFLIFTLDNNSFTFQSIRKNLPSCNFGEHSEQGLLDTISLISDCHAVIAAKIGPGAEKKLKEKGIKAIGEVGYIDAALQKIIAANANPC